jgi:hypothetical protein
MQCSEGPGLAGASVELSKHFFNLGIFLLDCLERLLDLCETLGLVRLIFGAIFILLLTVVLDLLTTILDLRQAKGGRRAFQEVAKRREISEIFVLTGVSTSVSAASYFVGGNVQGLIHLDESLLGLFEESKHNGPAEFAIILIIVHLEDLLEGHRVNAVAQIWETDGALLAL